MSRVAVILLLAVVACRDVPAMEHPDARVVDAYTGDASKAASCASTFGNALTSSFGRADGTIVAVVPPGHPTCPQPNGTHLVLQLMFDGAVYRMVTNLDVLTHAVDAPLAGEAWSPGWHPNAQLDYATTLGTTANDFDLNQDVDAWITNQLEIGAHVSVFATDQGYPDSAHLVHRNMTNMDGAIVVNPDTSPHYLLFRFSNQAF